MVTLRLWCAAAVAGAAAGSAQRAAPHGRRQEHAGLRGVTGRRQGAALPGGACLVSQLMHATSCTRPYMYTNASRPTCATTRIPAWPCPQVSAISSWPLQVQAADGDQLRRLQALLGLGRLPPRTFLSFLLLVTLGPGDRGGGRRATTAAGGAKRRRVATEQPAAVPSTVQRAIALTDATLSKVADDS